MNRTAHSIGKTGTARVSGEHLEPANEADFSPEVLAEFEKMHDGSPEGNALLAKARAEIAQRNAAMERAREALSQHTRDTLAQMREMFPGGGW